MIDRWLALSLLDSTQLYHSLQRACGLVEDTPRLLAEHLLAGLRSRSVQMCPVQTAPRGVGTEGHGRKGNARIVLPAAVSALAVETPRAANANLLALIVCSTARALLLPISARAEPLVGGALNCALNVLSVAILNRRAPARGGAVCASDVQSKYVLIVQQRLDSLLTQTGRPCARVCARSLCMLVGGNRGVGYVAK